MTRMGSYAFCLTFNGCGAGKVLAGQSLQVVFENEAIAVVDGQFGFGQTIGEQAMRLGIEKCARHGVAVIALRNTGHLGRIGDWPLMAAEAGKLSLHFVNTSGAGILVAPFGGTKRRLSANPIAAGIPMAGGSPHPARHLGLHHCGGQDQGRAEQGRAGAGQLHH